MIFLALTNRPKPTTNHDCDTKSASSFAETGSQYVVISPSKRVGTSATLAVTPPTVEQVADLDSYKHYLGRMTQNTHPVNLLELCSITMPAALDSAGMPVGLQLISCGGREERLLAAALACEKVLGTARQRLGTPPRCAE